MSTDTQNSAPVSAVRQGWRLVPIEPTVTMRIMGGSAAVQAGGSWGDVAVQGYKAMLDAAPVAAQPDLTQQDATLHAEVLDMVRMLEANEWADHCGKSELGQRLEWAITALQNRIAELTKSSNQQDADKVQADLLSSLVEIVDAVIASDEEGLIEHSEIIIKARAAIDAARKEPGQ